MVGLQMKLFKENSPCQLEFLDVKMVPRSFIDKLLGREQTYMITATYKPIEPTPQPFVFSGPRT